MRLTTQLIAWGAEWPKHRKPQRPLRLQYLRQERQTHQWRIHRPRRGQAVDGGAGEKGGMIWVFIESTHLFLQEKVQPKEL